MTNQDLRDLLELFGREQACYTSLLDLSRRQKEVIEHGEVDDLLQILGQKQKVLARVGEIENQLLPYKRNWPAVRAGLDGNDRQVLDLALSTVEELLAELIALERHSEDLLVKRRDLVEVELHEAAKGGAVQQVYQGKIGDTPSRILDVRGD